MALTALSLSTFLIGAAAGGFAAILRALPWPKPWLSKKPLGCALCMGFWSAVVLYLGLEWAIQLRAAVTPLIMPQLGTSLFGVQFLATVAISAWFNGQIIPPAILGLDDLEPKE